MRDSISSLVPREKRKVALLEELDNVSRRLERLYDALETGTLTLGDLAPRIQALRLRQEQPQTAIWELDTLLSDRKVELADVSTITSYVKDLRSLLSQSSLAERKSFVKSFVKEIKVRGSEVTISYTMPLSVDTVSEKVITVPHIVHDSGRYWTIDRTFSLAFSLTI